VPGHDATGHDDVFVAVFVAHSDQRLFGVEAHIGEIAMEGRRKRPVDGRFPTFQQTSLG
jgi:hypothetical protein